jgi:hypothetical protein
MTLRIACVLFILLMGGGPALAVAHFGIAPIPDEVRTDYFVVTINGHTTPVLHAASSYYLLNFDLDGPATVSIRAVDAHDWDRGVEIQPMRYGIRPVRRGATITFRIPGPVKLSVARPGDHFADAERLFLLGSPPDESHITAKTARVRYYAPGVNRERHRSANRRSHLSRARRSGLWVAESLAGARCARRRPRHDHLRRTAGPGGR